MTTSCHKNTAETYSPSTTSQQRVLLILNHGTSSLLWTHLIQRPRLPDFPPGSVSIGNMRADTISNHFQNFHLQPTSYNTTRLLTNPKFRMLFQNILQEPTNIVLNTMILFQKEIDRMFFRIAAKEYTGFESIGIEAIQKQDVPYRPCSTWPELELTLSIWL